MALPSAPRRNTRDDLMKRAINTPSLALAEANRRRDRMNTSSSGSPSSSQGRSDPIDFAKLEEVARAATPGPWWKTAGGVRAPSQGDYGVAYDCHFRDARHIATFDPPTVLALLSRIKEAEGENERLRTGGFTAKDGLQWVRKDDRDAAETALQAAQARIKVLEGALTKAEHKFAEYAALHIAKGTADGDIKSATNASMAAMCRAVLTQRGTNGK